MTIHITKFKAALALVVVALLVPVTAIATHTFSDVPDGRYYTDAVEWAAENEITTGTSATTFSRGDAVTRGQNVTFAYRYDQNIVQPALTELETLFPIARSTGSSVDVEADDGTAELLSVEIEAPAAGIIQLHGYVRVDSEITVPGEAVSCSFSDVPLSSGFDSAPELEIFGQVYYSGDPDEEATYPVSGALTVEAGTHAIYLRASTPKDSYSSAYQMNALFVPLGSNDFVDTSWPVVLSD
jgi:hypothetical protein